MTDYKRPRGHSERIGPVGAPLDPGVLTSPFHRSPWDRDFPREPQKWDVPPHGWPPIAPKKDPHMVTGHAELSREMQRRRPTPRGHCSERRTRFPELHDDFTHSGIPGFPTYVPERHCHKIMSQTAAIGIPGYTGHIPGHVAENILQTSFAKANQLSLTARRGYSSDVDTHFRVARHSRNHSDGGRNVLDSMRRRQEDQHPSKGHSIRSFGVHTVMP
eukprot:gnl/MRDRNA2_/MRDRNA2_106686_c0_seq1.p1 gnl/MRDRNA2_/MRDRNA2_106686_c0~~gnl/MRDRNA2_/MRDRNA2_106686_c0_seq1.p1  ORF type:complete len:217 (+),score=24.77 gnl/MRDRNA2_/MRDRNA2_106686_c0_seq1:70-720(+)